MENSKRVSASYVTGTRKRELTADGPRFNTVTERPLGIIEVTQQTVRIQARTLFGEINLPEGDNLWDEETNLASDSLHGTSTSANPDHQTPYEKWYGRATLIQLRPFLKPDFVHRQHQRKHCTKGVKCF